MALCSEREKKYAVPDDVLCPQAKLEEALTLATDFHNSLQDFINWLTQAEQTLNMVSPASLILETIMFQIDEHKVMFERRGGLRDLWSEKGMLMTRNFPQNVCA